MSDRVSPGERMWLRRKALCLSQREFCRKFGLSRGRLSAMELDRLEIPPRLLEGVDVGVRPTLALLRRRSGLTLLGVAGVLGVSGVTVLAWERASDPRLIAWWAAAKRK